MWNLVDKENQQPTLSVPTRISDFNGPFPKEDFHKGTYIDESGSMMNFDESSYSAQEVDELLGSGTSELLRRMKVQKAMQRQPQSESPFQRMSWSEDETQGFKRPSVEDMEIFKILKRDPVEDFKNQYYMQRAGEENVPEIDLETLKLLRQINQGR